MSTPLKERKCERRHCTKRFTPIRKNGKFCSKQCAHRVSNAQRRSRCNNVSRDHIPAWMGKPIIPAHGAPMCHGQALSFGSDPHTGVSIQYCRVCGESQLQRYGEVKYPQREDLEAEMDKHIAKAKAKVERGGRERRQSWHNSLTIIGKALKDKIEAA